MCVFTVIFILALRMFNNAESISKPNIIMIVADDMGWNDVSFHGSDQIPTPNIDALAYNGLILNNHYMQPTCTPSRTALMTGKYPIYTGLQGPPLKANDARALPPGKILPGYMKDLGYTTRLVGKWHLGHKALNETPTYRGFDSHFGYWTGANSYYDHIRGLNIDGKTHYGHDFYRNTTTAWDLQGQYTTRLFSEEAKRIISEHDDEQGSKPLFLMMCHMGPHGGNEGKFLEAPLETIQKFSYIPNADRRTYAAMMAEVDDSVGVLVQALKDKNMLNNTVIVFSSDNGGPTIGLIPNWSSNYPLRGTKGTLWEGGVRTAAFIWSPLLHRRGIHEGLVHVTDWLPTFISIAGGDPSSMRNNGIDQWASLKSDSPSPRTEILLNIEDIEKNSAIRRNNWKLILGIYQKGKYDSYYGDSGVEVSRPSGYDIAKVRNSPAGRALAESGYIFKDEEALKMRQMITVKCPNRENIPKGRSISDCNPTDEYSICLFDLEKDPCETRDLARANPHIVSELKMSIEDYRRNMSPQLPPVNDPRGFPKYYNFTWSHWLDQEPTTHFEF